MITINEIITSVSESCHPVILEFHNRAVAAGFVPFASKSSKKDNFGKVEYKKAKKEDPLYILHVNGQKWSLRCKLFHLDRYEELLLKFREPVLKAMLASRACKGPENGCDVGIEFTADGKEYNLCRHAIHFKDLHEVDVDDVWSLLEAEARYR